MTGHLFGDVVVVSVAVIVVSWLVSALFGWFYLLWLLLPPLTAKRRVVQPRAPLPPGVYRRPRDPRLGE